MYWVLAQGDFYISRVVAAGIYVYGIRISFFIS